MSERHHPIARLSAHTRAGRPGLRCPALDFSLDPADTCIVEMQEKTIYSPSDTPRGLRRGFVFWGATTVLVGSEKGIDVRLALDVVVAARTNTCDVALIFSQDQDLSELADEVRAISIHQNRWIKIACVFPTSPTYANTRGINKTDWVRIDRKTCDACLDHANTLIGYEISFTRPFYKPPPRSLAEIGNNLEASQAEAEGLFDQIVATGIAA